MKYVNGKDIFPSEVLELIQNYSQGQYVYIPKKNESKERWGAKTSYQKELKLRNSNIYTKHLTGLSVKQIGNSYHLSEKSINRIILQKRKDATKMKSKIKELLGCWNINCEIQQIYDTVWSVGTDYVIKTYTDFDGLVRNIETIKSLNECGIPVAKPIPALDGREYVQSNGVYFLLMNKLKGNHIKDIYQEYNYQNIAYETGKIIARLHMAFLVCEHKLSYWDNNLIDEMTGWVNDNLKENQYRYCTEADFNASVKELQDCYDKLPRQLIHRDMHYGNILFYNSEFSGYVDFDLTQKNVRIFDICYMLIGLLIDHEKIEADVYKWYEIISHFIKGYDEISKLTESEKDSICCLMKNIELMFVAFFVGKEDEASAETAAKLYYFVLKNEKAIRFAVNKFS